MSDAINPYNAGPTAMPGAPTVVGVVDEVAYELAINDLVAFALDHQKKSPTIRRRRRVTCLLLPAVLFAVGALMLLVDVIGGAFVSFVGAATLLLVPSLQRRATARILAKVYAEGSNRAVLGWRRLSIGREGVVMISDLVESRIKWPAIEKIDTSNEHLFIYISSMSAHVVPIRAFASAMHFSAFVESARGYWRQARDAIGPTA
ncbi:MAG TPA: YcxB family protein [Pirellulales bacterium]|nr:YcxB family protein [Pirellulales bacterium]